MYPNTVEKINIKDNITVSIRYDYYNGGASEKPQEIILSNKLIDISNDMFADCKELRSIVIPESVKSIGSFAFNNCTSLDNIIIPESVTYIGNNAFYECISLNSIVIPESIEYIEGYAFNGWSANQTIYFECSEKESENWDYNWKSNCNANIVWNYNPDGTTE